MFIDIKEIPCENFSEAEASVITKKQRSYIQKFVQKFFMSPVIVKAQKNRQNFAKRPSSRRYTARWVSLYIRLFLNHVGGGVICILHHTELHYSFQCKCVNFASENMRTGTADCVDTSPIYTT